MSASQCQSNALLNLFLTLVNPGQNVLLPEPYFPLYGPDVTILAVRTNIILVSSRMNLFH